MASITGALAELKRDPLRAIQGALIEAVCRAEGYDWRERLLSPVVTIGLFIQQVLHGNTRGQAMGHIAQQPFSASAWCQARTRLFRQTLRKVYEANLPKGRTHRHLWQGHRTFHIDGTGVTLWDSPTLRKAFGLPGGVKKGCGFPVAHLLVLFKAHNGLLVDAAMVAEPGTKYVLSQYRMENRNLRTGLERIIWRAGLKPWPKLFNNLRSSRETELAETMPMHVVCRWMGNSKPVAAEHYLQVMDAHFLKAVEKSGLKVIDEKGLQQKGTAFCAASGKNSEAAHFAAQQGGGNGRKPAEVGWGGNGWKC